MYAQSLCMHNFSENLLNLCRWINFEIFFLNILSIRNTNNVRRKSISKIVHIKDTN